MFHVPAHKAASAGQVSPAADVIAAAAIQQSLEVEYFIDGLGYERHAPESEIELWAERGGYAAGLARPLAPWERSHPAARDEMWDDIEF